MNPFFGLPASLLRFSEKAQMQEVTLCLPLQRPLGTTMLRPLMSGSGSTPSLSCFVFSHSSQEFSHVLVAYDFMKVSHKHISKCFELP